MKLKINPVFIALLFVFICCNACKNNPHKISDENTNTSKDTEKTDAIQLGEKKNYFPPSFLQNVSNSAYTLNTDSSKLNWFCVTHHGTVMLKQGKLIVENEKIQNSDFQIIMDSIQIVDIDYMLMREVLINTLKSEDFFYTKKYPYSTFELKNIQAFSNDSCLVDGLLTIKNIQKPVSFLSAYAETDQWLKFNTEPFYIDRTKWGLTLYSRNYEQTDKSFLFTDSITFQLNIHLNKVIAE